ncbi:MAG TPA: hypothetical protein VNS63_25535 [Blastocatellia bacterium]|nr:hypothetical protein [Blastocatellia bacterium]
MKTRNRSTRNTTKLIAALIVVGTLAASWTIWGASRAEAVIAIIRQTGVFSLAQGQATSAHVVNTGEDREQTWWCTVFDGQGNTLAESEHRILPPGQASSFEYRPLELAEGQRMAIRLELRVEGASRNKRGFIATQEVYNVGDGKTTVFLPYLEQ